MIAYLRVVPGFWIAVEELRLPELRSRPVIIGGLPHERGVVREVNVLARRYAVHPGMTLSQAHQHCPEGVFLVPDLPRYEPVWEAICDVLGSCTPLVEPLEMGQAVLDLSGSERRWSSARDAARAVISRVHAATGITPWLGVASNRLVAQLASMVVDEEGITVVEAGQERAFLAPLPLTLLPDLDARLALSFSVLGLRTIGQLAALPRNAVRQRFGAAGERLHRWAQGIDPRPVVPPREPPSVSARYECEDGSLEEAAAALERLAEACAAELQGRHLVGRLVQLRLVRAGSFPGDGLPSGGTGWPPLGKMGWPPLGAATTGTGIEEGVTSADLPVSRRIHSMLPQPPAAGRALDLPPAGEGALPAVPTAAEPLSAPENEGKVCAALRLPVDTAPPLLEQAHRLLTRVWPRELEGRDDPTLQAIELTVSEFEPPAQLSFTELDRLDEAGALRGMSPERRQALAFHEELLAARHGTEPFRHLAEVDPRNILTERRFRWQAGLPPDRAASRATNRAARRKQ